MTFCLTKGRNTASTVLLPFQRCEPDLNRRMTVLQTGALPLGYRTIFYYISYICAVWHIYDSNGNRTRVTAVKGRCLNRLTMEPVFL